MSIEAMKQALEALEDANDMAYSEFSSENLYGDAITALRQAIAEAENQEPVAWAMLHDNGDFIDAICPEEHAREEGEYTTALYTHPQPKREWVGLTANELDEIDEPIRKRGSATIAEIYRAIEAKLKEKNT